MAGEEQDSGERSEEATPQRREEFRKQGQVAMTRELGSALLLFGAAAVIWMMGQYLGGHISGIFRQSFGAFPVLYGKSGDLVPVLKYAALHGFFVVGPVLLVAGILAFASTTLQIGFMTNTEALSPKFEKLNPISGFQKIASLRSVVEGIKATLKVGLVGLIAYLVLKGEIDRIPLMGNMGVDELIQYFGAILTRLLFSVGLFMVVLAILDYSYNWWDLEKRMKMTKQELKEEIKTREGNPQVKARLRKLQRDLATKRMMEAVPKADVIITNPTHIAVALKYDSKLPAPQVVAKGADLIAEKIREIAKANNIPIVENKPLARAMYKTLKVGQLIPRELFHAVAEVLAYVFKLKRKVHV